MSFQIIKAETRTARMISWFSGTCQDITDFVVGSKIRSKFEAISIEMESQDFAWYQSLKKAIPVAIYRAFDFNLRPAQKAVGTVTFSITSPATAAITIPSGTQVSTISSANESEKIYTTNNQVAIGIGQTSVDADVTCTVPGAIGNTGTGTITTLKNTINGVETVTNAEPVSGGSERETEEQRRIRFIEYVSTLSRGTIAAVEYGAKTSMIFNEAGEVVETVANAVVYEPFMHDANEPVGVFRIYIYNGYGDTSDELVAAAQQAVDGYVTESGTKIPGWKAAGVICQMLKATETTLDITASVLIRSGYDTGSIENLVITAFDQYIGAIGIGKPFIYNELIERIMGIDGVYNCSVTVPVGDMTPQFNEVYISGEKVITVTSL